MEIDWNFLTWFVPLVVGAALTFTFGWLDSTIKYRRELRLRSVNEAQEIAERQRIEAREHAVVALTVASRIRDAVEPPPLTLGGAYDSSRDAAADWDADDVKELSDLGVLIPDPVVREIIASACNLVTAADSAAQACDYDESPREIQRSAMFRLRKILGAHLRIEAPDAEDLAWMRGHAERQELMWAEYKRLDEERRTRDPLDLSE